MVRADGLHENWRFIDQSEGGVRVAEARKLRDRYSLLRAISNQRLGRESRTDSVNASQMNLTKEEGPHSTIGALQELFL
jgi:hypothetical protein